MAKLKAKLNKDDFSKLDKSLQEFYVASGDDYVLDAEGVEDVTGLKSKITELLKDTKNKGDLLKQFEGLDAEAARKALEEMEKIEEQKLADKGEYENLLAKHKTESEKKFNAATEAHQKTLAGLKSEKLTNFLVKNGVLPDRAKYALSDVESLLDLEEKDDGFHLKSKDGSELDQLVGNLKTTSGFLFAASGTSGTGGTGGDGDGGDSKQMTRTAFDAMSHQEQAEFSISGGSLTD